MKKKIKPEKYVWNETDFDDLGWHDNRIHAVFFDHVDFTFSISIDYIYRWEKNFVGYWATPARMSFMNISNLKIDISFNDMSDLIIEDIIRSEQRITSNGLLIENEYIVRTNVGLISLFSTGFELELKQDAEFSESQDAKT
jgi:hypothetical protein